MTRPLRALFHGRLGDSRLAELEATARRAGAPPVAWTWDPTPHRTLGGDVGPSVVQSLPSVPAHAHGPLATAAARAVGCRGVFEVWGQGDSLADCAASTTHLAPSWIRQRIAGPWRLVFPVLGARHSAHARDPGVRARHFGHLLDALDGVPVKLRGPAQELWLVEDRRQLEDGAPLPRPTPRVQLLYKLPTTATPIQPTVSALDLRRRPFLGTSTLVPDRALLMCNLGLAEPTQHKPTVLDPCCGSGGILLAAAAWGADTVGTDIDWRVVSDNRVPIAIPATPDRPGRGTEAVRMTDNFDDLGLPHPRALFPLDVHQPDSADRLLAANGGRRYDALITDPPYGIRESTHGALQGQSLSPTLQRLLALTEDTVRPGGRLVCLVPVRSPKSPTMPTIDALRDALDAAGATHGLLRVHLGVEAVHQGLYRATVAMVHTG